MDDAKNLSMPVCPTIPKTSLLFLSNCQANNQYILKQYKNKKIKLYNEILAMY